MGGNEARPRASGRNARKPLPILRYPEDALYEEMAFVAYHLHWPLDDLLNMEHAERHRWIEEISKINRRITDQSD